MQKQPQSFFDIICSINSSVAQIYEAIFELRTINNEEAIDYLKKGFHYLNSIQPRSCLLLHEIAYALGQADLKLEPLITQFLIDVVVDIDQYDVVRHEAAEALANINQVEAIKIFIHYSKENGNDELNILRDTCIIGLEKAQTIHELGHLYGKQYLGTREPAAPFEEFKENPIEYILNQETTLFNKYRALYYIRNNPKDHFKFLGDLLLSKQLGALFKHEICFVIGQVGQAPPEVHKALIEMIRDEEAPAIARHEAIAAFQTVSSSKEQTLQILNEYSKCENQIVRETALVSLKMLEFYG